MITFVIAQFLAFVVWVESYRLRIYIRDLTNQINTTLGRADWVYSNKKEQKSWMQK